MQVRIATVSDAAAIAGIYAPYVRDTAISFESEPPEAEAMAERIAETLPQLPWLVAQRAGQIVGTAYASKHRERPAYRWSVNVGIYVSTAAQRSGAGRALYQKLITILKHQGFHSAFAGIALPNPASIGLHETLGFRPLGIYEQVGFKHGKWHDVGWWRLGLSEAVGAPDEPIPFAALAEKY